MDAADIAPSALTPDLADRLARTAPRGRDTMIRLHNLARRFAEHLIGVGVASLVLSPVTKEQAARAQLLADFEAYLGKQRGLGKRTRSHLLHHGVDQEVIALWLGHESVAITQIYIHADMRMKEKALARVAAPATPTGRFRPDDKLLAFLEGL